jgi:hypothetical protein
MYLKIYNSWYADNKRLEQVAETFSFYSRSGGNLHQAQAASTTLLRLRL